MIDLKEMKPEFRLMILERDNFTCMKCQKRDFNNILQVHHLNRNPSDNNEKNLITLCIKCHHLLHSMLWKARKERLKR